jgi:hypothetical protein
MPVGGVTPVPHPWISWERVASSAAVTDQDAGSVGLPESGPGQDLIDEAGGGSDESGEDAADPRQGWPARDTCRHPRGSRTGPLNTWHGQNAISHASRSMRKTRYRSLRRHREIRHGVDERR